MYCSHCGAKETGNFCSQCGTKLATSDLETTETTNWHDEIDYSKLLTIPEVGRLISQAEKNGTRNLSMEEILALFGDTLKPLTGGVSLEKIADISRPLSSKLDLKVRKNRCTTLAEPPGKIIVKFLCWLAKSDQKVVAVNQAHDGCIIEATLPSDIWSRAGNISVMVKRKNNNTLFEATSEIKGQMFDFGKSERLLDNLFEYIHEE